MIFANQSSTASTYIQDFLIIINQLFGFNNLTAMLYPWMLQVYYFGYSIIMTLNSLIHTSADQIYHFGHYSVMALSSWFNILIETIGRMLITSLLLIISFAIFSRLAKKRPQNQSFTSEHPSIDSFIESIERSPKLSESKPKPPSEDLKSWALRIQRQADKDNENINNDPDETSLFADDYISQSEHNKVLASLDDHIGHLTKFVSKFDNLSQKYQSDNMASEKKIELLQDKIHRLENEKVNRKKAFDDLQMSHVEKDCLICELQKKLATLNYENTMSWMVEDQSSLQQVASSSEAKQKDKDGMPYIPPNRRPASQA